MDVVGGHRRSQWVRRALPHFLAEGRIASRQPTFLRLARSRLDGSMNG